MTELVFVSPWRTRVVIPLKDIRDLSIGQFQMWTTPWVTKCEPVFFLSITSGTTGSERTIHLTPVRAGATMPALINTQVAEWFEAIRQAVVDVTGASPHVSEPTAVAVRAPRSWIRRAGPLLFFAPLTAWFVAIMSIRSPFGPAPLAPWIGAVILLLLLCLKLGWFAFGFWKANRALKSGDLDAVTSDEPPGDAGDIAGDRLPLEEGERRRARKPLWWTACAWAFVLSGSLAVMDTLTGLYSRPMNQTFYLGIVHLFVGIAMLTLSRRWRLVALAGLAVTLVAGLFICVMMVVSPEHGSISFPPLNSNVPVTEIPRLAATAVFFLALALGAPCYLLMSARGKAVFGLIKRK